ncbi:hypothetical protein ABHN01_19745 [Fictibacillus sp. NRS-1165]
MEYFPTLFDKTIVSVEIGLYSLQIIFLILFSFPKVPFRLQKLQSLLVLFNAFQISTIGYLFLVPPGMTDYRINNKTLIFVGLLILGAIIVHVWAMIDGFIQVKKGEFKQGSFSLIFFNKTKIIIILISVVYSNVLILTLLIKNGYSLENIFFYFPLTLILYAVAIAAAEFELLVYCKFKFPSFRMTWEERLRDRERARRKSENKRRRELEGKDF